MQLGVMTHLSENIDEAFKKVHDLGFNSCQLCSWVETLRTDENAEKVKEACKKYDVTISTFWCGWSGPMVWDFYEGPHTLGLVPKEYRYARMKELMQGSDFAKKIGVENVAILQSQIIFLVKETFTLNARHIEDIELWHGRKKVGGLLVRNAVLFHNLGFYVVGYTKLVGRDQHKFDARIAGKCRDKRVNGTTEFEVSAKADSHIGQSSLLARDGEKIRQGLRGVIVSAVTCIDNGNGGVHRCYKRRSLFGVTHSDNIGIAGNSLCRIRNTLALCGRRRISARNREDIAAKLIHRRFKAQARARRWLKEQCC